MNPVRESGVLLVLVGLLLGPRPGLGVLDASTLRVLAPLTALGIGWIGASFGSRLEWRVLRRIPRSVWTVAAVQAAAAFALTAIAAWLLTRALPALTAAWHPTLPALLAIAATAAVSSPHAVALAAQRAGAGTRLADRLAISALLDTLLGACLFALTLAFYHPRATFPGGFGWLGWLAVAVAASGGVGLLFLWLSRLGRESEAQDLELLGVVLVGAGVGYAVELSPFIVCALATALIVNRVPFRRRQVQSALRRWEHPVYAGVLVAAGALLRLPTLWLVAAVLVLGVVRIAARWASARLVWTWAPGPRLPPQVGLATVAQGGVAVALGLSFGFVHADAGAVFTTVLLGVAFAQAALGPLVALAFRPARGEVTA
ncbi:MAG TPA: hypothetical protein VGJ83_06600 [Gemmatimonadales bacterium]